ncbi:MAG: Recombination protein RecR [Opitutia bacterium UBA7350]|nr:MAG: Recombination protein RecR [Opitutae bacterium UBA7350]
MALHLLVEQPETGQDLMSCLSEAAASVRQCAQCGNLSETELCGICLDKNRDITSLCVVEHVQDLFALERSGAWKGGYHVLCGKLSPIHGIGPEQLNMGSLKNRIQAGEIKELVLALSNDIEGQATCHYIQEELVEKREIEITRIGFGLPSGGGVTYADSVTLRSALDSRRSYE